MLERGVELPHHRGGGRAGLHAPGMLDASPPPERVTNRARRSVAEGYRGLPQDASTYIRNIEGAGGTSAYALEPRLGVLESSRTWRAAPRLASQAFSAAAALT